MLWHGGVDVVAGESSAKIHAACNREKAKLPSTNMALLLGTN